jgi:biopolymer transport protein ExbD
MAKTFGISLTSTFLLILLFTVHYRIRASWYSERTHPSINLPTAQCSTKYCHGRSIPQLSLNKQGQWIAKGHAPMKFEQAQEFIRTSVTNSKKYSHSPALRLRIAGKEKAHHFLNIVKSAHIAGVKRLFIAVKRPR